MSISFPLSFSQKFFIKNVKDKNQPSLKIKNSTYVFQSSAGGGEIVEGIARDPHHGGEGHEEPHAMGPGRILRCSVFDGFPLEAIEEKDDPHDCWSNSPPGEYPI